MIFYYLIGEFGNSILYYNYISGNELMEYVNVYSVSVSLS